MIFAKSSQQRRRWSAILSLAAVTLVLAWSSPSYMFDFGVHNDKPRPGTGVFRGSLVLPA